MRCWQLVGLVMGVLLFCSGPARAAEHDQAKFTSGRSKVVEEFMALMVERQLISSASRDKLAEIDRKMLALLAPYYFETLGIEPEGLTINKYSPDGFRVLAEQGAFVVVKLLRKNQAGPMLLVFKTAAYRDGFVIEPSAVSLFGRSDPSLVTPWFYAAEQADLTMEALSLPGIGTPVKGAVVPAPQERVREEGVQLVKTLLAYLGQRGKAESAARREAFARQIRPLLARAYTDLYGIDLNYYEEVAADSLAGCKVTGAVDEYVVLECAECLYDWYSFRLVQEGGQLKILPTGIDNARRTISPVWQRE